MSNRLDIKPSDVIFGALLAVCFVALIFIQYAKETGERISTITAQVEQKSEEVRGLKVQVEQTAASADVWKAKAERHYADKVALRAKLAAKRQKERAEAARPWNRTEASWYGPGFMGRGTACGQRLTSSLRGVAILGRGRWSSFPCGTKLTIRNGSRTVKVRVIDRGGHNSASRMWDLTPATKRDIGAGSTTQVMWRRGW